jgi:phosphoribosylanthranilate isomerase
VNFLTPTAAGTCRAKICGLRVLEDALYCAEQEADAIGLNFWPKSKRYLDPDIAADWADELPEAMTRIGVFVNEPIDAVRSLLDKGIIHAAQLHGDETPEDCALLRGEGHCILKAIGVRDETSLEQLSNFEVDAIVLDALCPGEYGGSGKTFNWALALRAKEMIADTPLILSGGLVGSNVAAAIQRVHPWAVDVASGVESEPGLKSRDMIAVFLQAVRSA